MKLFQILPEIFGWLQIVFAFVLGFGLIAGIVYLKMDNDSGKIFALMTISIGFLIGAVLATIVWRKHGTVEWLSRGRKTS